MEKDKWSGSQYSKNSLLQYNAAMEFLREQKFKGDDSVLDVGCGDGKITSQIAMLVPQGKVLGIDASPSMLETANNSFHQENLKFLLKDVQKLDFISEFDVATSFFCLQWVPNKLAAFSAIAKGLKPQGKLIMIAPMIGRLIELTNELMITPRWKHYFTDFGDPLITARDTQYDNYAKQAGFIINNYRIEPITTTYSSRKELSNWLFAVTPHITRISLLEEKQSFIEETINLYLKEFPSQADGSCYTEFTLIKLTATNAA